jgi:hypothetical protein
MTDYLVDNGNWKVRVSVDKDCPSPYMEAATRAVEAVFGMKELDSSCEIISLVDNEGIDYFSEDADNSGIYPQPMFSIVTLVCKYRDANKGSKYVPFLTSKVFENAGQPTNVELALKAESLEPEKVKQFLELQELLEKKRKKKS